MTSAIGVLQHQLQEHSQSCLLAAMQTKLN